MHFWIDKRSQCAYTGRHRVPSSLSAGRGRVGVGVGVGVGVRKAGAGMAAPLHRFAHVQDCAPRRHRPHPRHNGPPSVPVHTARRANQDTMFVEIPEQPTIASLAAARSVTPDTLLRTAALGLHHSPIMAPHLKFGMLVSFALASLFLAGAKYYFDKQVVRGTAAARDSTFGGAGEASVVCVAVAAACAVGCALAVCKARTPPPPAVPDRVSSTARRGHDERERRRQTPSSEPSDDISLTTLLQSNRTSDPPEPEAPPPYHIAVLLPGRESQPSDPDVSPPAYSALS